jgi:hypothetical protein
VRDEIGAHLTNMAQGGDRIVTGLADLGLHERILRARAPTGVMRYHPGLVGIMP